MNLIRAVLAALWIALAAAAGTIFAGPLAADLDALGVHWLLGVGALIVLAAVIAMLACEARESREARDRADFARSLHDMREPRP